MDRYPIYLNGKWADSPHRLSVSNPVTGEAFAEVATVDRPKVAEALRTADAAFPEWRSLTAVKRGIICWPSPGN